MNTRWRETTLILVQNNDIIELTIQYSSSIENNIYPVFAKTKLCKSCDDLLPILNEIQTIPDHSAFTKCKFGTQDFLHGND